MRGRRPQGPLRPLHSAEREALERILSSIGRRCTRRCDTAELTLALTG